MSNVDIFYTFSVNTYVYIGDDCPSDHIRRKYQEWVDHIILVSYIMYQYGRYGRMHRNTG